MSDPNTQPDPGEAIRAIRSLVEAQDLRAAKTQLRQLQSNTDDATWAMIVEIANTLRFKTRSVALTKLRNLWRHNEQFRAIIEACVPKQGERQYIPEPASSRQVDVVPATGNLRSGRVKSRIEPDRCIEPSQRTRTPSIKVVDDYEKTLAKDERDDPGKPRDELIVDRHDYDTDATHPISDLCVSCRLERARIDSHTGQVRTGRGDDGLCGECRSLGRPGVPELPPGHSYSDQIHARLEYLAEHFHTESRGIFRQEWRLSDREGRAIISEWVKTHTQPTPQPEPIRVVARALDLNDWCTSCNEYRQLADHGAKLCFDCDPHSQLAVVPAGGIEPRLNTDGREMRSTAREPAVERTSGTQPQSGIGRNDAAHQEPSKEQRISAAAQPVAEGSTAAVRGKPVQNPREMTAAAAQQRRRAMSRRSRTEVTKPGIR